MHGSHYIIPLGFKYGALTCDIGAMCSVAVTRNLTRPSCDIVNTCDMIKELVDARDGFNTLNYFNADEILCLIESVWTCWFYTFLYFHIF